MPLPPMPKLTDEEWFALVARVRGAEARQPLPTAEAALAYAQGVIAATDGAEALAQQGPYRVEERGESWLVTGTRSRMAGILDPVHVELRKADAGLVDYGMTGFGGRVAPPLRD